MWTILLFWAVLWIPGALLARRFLPTLVAGGAPVVIALGYLGSFALLTPVAWLSFVFGGPLLVLSGAAVAIVIIAVVLWVTGRTARPPLQRPDAVAALGGAVLAAELWASAQLGSHLQGDGPYHVARIRSLLDNGFNNVSALVPGGVEGIYYGNLYHALAASSAQLVGAGPVDAWIYLLVFAKLVIACSAGTLAWALFQQRWAVWSSVALSAVWWGPLTILSYPNKVGPFAFMALGIAVWVAAVRAPAWSTALALAATSAVTASIHPLYAAFLGLCLGPATVVIAAWRYRGDPRLARATLALLLSLGAGGPQLVAGKLAQRRAPTPMTHGARPVLAAASPAQGASIAAASSGRSVAKTKNMLGGLRKLGDGRFMAPAHRWIRLGSPYPYLLLLPVLIALRRRRRDALYVLAPLLSVGACLHIPWVCSALVDLAGAPWILGRLTVVFDLVMHAAIPGLVGTALLLLPWGRVAATVVQPVLLLSMVGYAHAKGIDQENWPRRALEDRLAINRRLPKTLATHRRVRELLTHRVPAGSLVVARAKKDHHVIMHHSIFPLAVHPRRGSLGVGDMGTRRVDAKTLLAVKTPRSHRLALMRYYGVKHILLRRGGLEKRVRLGYGSRVKRRSRAGSWVLLHIETSP